MELDRFNTLYKLPVGPLLTKLHMVFEITLYTDLESKPTNAQHIYIYTHGIYYVSIFYIS